MDDVTGNLFFFVLFKTESVFKNVCEITSDSAGESLEEILAWAICKEEIWRKRRQKELLKTLEYLNC